MGDEQVNSSFQESTELLDDSPPSDDLAETDDLLRNIGVIIVICSLLLVFGGESFSWWEIEMQVRSEGDNVGFTFKLGTTELYADGYLGKETNSYSDTECNCEEMDALFTNLRMMLLGLICCSALLANIGYTGEKKHLVPRLLAGTFVISLLILVYAFYSIPEIYDEETDFFKDIDEDPIFYGHIEKQDWLEDNIELDVYVGPSLGFFLPLLSLILSIYLIKIREISFKDVTG